ncbi:DUF6750 family protein [Enterobacter wuhouensis]|uniref:DUF6750 family protein n=1 Tax=Enterobacter wuhouensis TaxID=2529381 RepID=UPI002FD795D9
MSLFRTISARLYAVVIFCQLTLLQCRERMIRTLCALATFLVPGAAFADGDIADMLSNVADGAKSGKTSGLTIAQAIGVFILIGSLLSFKKIGTNPQITLGRCVAGLVIGALLAVVPEVMSRTQKQLGTSAVSIS